MLDSTFFRRIGPNVRDRYRKHIFKDAKDVYDKPFKDYKKNKKGISIYGQRKRANTFKRQASQYANSKAPVLTSDLLRDYSLIKTSTNGFQIGWTTLGARVEHLKKMGRVLTHPDQPLPKGVETYLSTEAHKYIKKKLGPNKTTIHRIGKK
tara:strand:- start:8123 stop:8575 length:453 start_codon:yes stop_codon:yes gene_type:complete